VATVVLKLFNMCRPDVAVFGMKDYQQVRVIERMVADLDVPVRIVRYPTVREHDGLAMSSRNAFLSEEERARAPVIHRTLASLAAEVAGGGRDAEGLAAEGRAAIEAAGARVEYLAACDPDTLDDVKTVDGPVLFATAAFFGRTRLIDNELASP
jgi:pantoate--beta-alanine ligase